MKINPIVGTHAPGTSLNNQGHSAERLAAAKSIAAGESPLRINPSETPVDPQVELIKNSLRTLKMKTQTSHNMPIEQVETQESAITDTNEQTQAVIEDTKPLSPQIAALAKQRRALQVKEREIALREKALESGPTKDGSQDLIARLKSQPLSVLQEHGVTYDQLTEAILADQNGINPQLIELQNKIKALEEGVEQKFVDRESQAEQAALTEMLNEAEVLAKTGDEYALVRENDKFDEVLRHIYTTYKKTGRVMDVTEALKFVEDKLFNQVMKYAAIDKVKSKFLPTQTQVSPQQKLQQSSMKTLTNRNSASPGMSRRERALMAAQGLLTKG